MSGLLESGGAPPPADNGPVSPRPLSLYHRAAGPKSRGVPMKSSRRLRSCRHLLAASRGYPLSYYALEMRGGSRIFAVDQPVRKGSVVLFHRYPDGDLHEPRRLGGREGGLDGGAAEGRKAGARARRSTSGPALAGPSYEAPPGASLAPPPAILDGRRLGLRLLRRRTGEEAATCRPGRRAAAARVAVPDRAERLSRSSRPPGTRRIRAAPNRAQRLSHPRAASRRCRRRVSGRSDGA